MSRFELDIRCVRCKKKPDEIEEYIEYAKSWGLTPQQFVQQEEGTYNSRNGHFACTSCYIAMGQPSLPFPHSWCAP